MPLTEEESLLCRITLSSLANEHLILRIGRHCCSPPGLGFRVLHSPQAQLTWLILTVQCLAVLPRTEPQSSQMRIDLVRQKRAWTDRLCCPAGTPLCATGWPSSRPSWPSASLPPTCAACPGPLGPWATPLLAEEVFLLGDMLPLEGWFLLGTLWRSSLSQRPGLSRVREGSTPSAGARRGLALFQR